MTTKIEVLQRMDCPTGCGAVVELLLIVETREKLLKHPNPLCQTFEETMNKAYAMQAARGVR